MLFRRALLRDLANLAGVVFATLFTIMVTTSLIRLLGRVTKAGRTVSVVDGQAVQPHPRDPARIQVVATMTATVMTVTGREDVRG